MGDRVNIAFEQANGKRIFFYGHWSGDPAPKLVQQGLAKGRDRWTDEAYLARIVFQTFLGGDTGTTGFGISTSIGDNEYPLIVVDARKQQVRFEDAERASYHRGAIGKAVGFKDYLDITMESDPWGAIETYSQAYDHEKIADELYFTAMGHAYHGNALRAAKDFSFLTGEDRSVLDRYATGKQGGVDHVRLQEIASLIRSAGGAA